MRAAAGARWRERRTAAWLAAVSRLQGPRHRPRAAGRGASEIPAPTDRAAGVRATRSWPVRRARGLPMPPRAAPAAAPGHRLRGEGPPVTERATAARAQAARCAANCPASHVGTPPSSRNSRRASSRSRAASGSGSASARAASAGAVPTR